MGLDIVVGWCMTGCKWDGWRKTNSATKKFDSFLYTFTVRMSHWAGVNRSEEWRERWSSIGSDSNPDMLDGDTK